jgi:peptidoglycan/LPS O-acetylase OafA/YrhL
VNATQNTARSTLHNTAKRARRVFPAIATAALLVALGSLPAAARQDPGPIVPEHQATTAPYSCAIQRVGTQFVRCDNLTGNGVPAPAWVDER